MKAIILINLKEWTLIPFKNTNIAISNDKTKEKTERRLYFLCFCLYLSSEKVIDASDELKTLNKV